MYFYHYLTNKENKFTIFCAKLNANLTKNFNLQVSWQSTSRIRPEDSIPFLFVAPLRFHDSLMGTLSLFVRLVGSCFSNTS